MSEKWTPTKLWMSDKVTSKEGPRKAPVALLLLEVGNHPHLPRTRSSRVNTFSCTACTLLVNLSAIDNFVGANFKPGRHIQL